MGCVEADFFLNFWGIKAQCLQREMSMPLKNFCIVDFVQDPQVIPSSWLLPDLKAYHWPHWASTLDQVRYDKAIKKCPQPADDWGEELVLRVRATKDDFQAIRLKLKTAEDLSGTDINTCAEDGVAKRSRHIRKRKLSSSDSSCGEEDGPSLQKLTNIKPPSLKSATSGTSKTLKQSSLWFTSTPKPSISPQKAVKQPPARTSSSDSSGYANGTRRHLFTDDKRSEHDEPTLMGIIIPPKTTTPTKDTRSNQDTPAKNTRAIKDTPAKYTRTDKDTPTKNTRANQDTPTKSSRANQDTPTKRTRANQDTPTKSTRSNQDTPTKKTPAKNTRAKKDTPTDNTPTRNTRTKDNHTKASTRDLAENMTEPEFKVFVVSNIKVLRANQAKLFTLLANRPVHLRENRNALESIRDVLTGLPTSSIQEWEEFEEKLSDEAYMADVMDALKQLGGDSLGTVVRSTLQRVMSNEVAKLFSWKGGKGKLKFCMQRFKTVLFRIVRLHTKYEKATDKEIVDPVSKWMAQATQRATSYRKRSQVEQAAIDPPQE